jgi:hypothetical protein
MVAGATKGKGHEDKAGNESKAMCVRSKERKAKGRVAIYKKERKKLAEARGVRK